MEKVTEPDFWKKFLIWRYLRKRLQISPKSDILIFFSRTAATIFLVFGLKLVLNMIVNLNETYFPEKLAIWRYLTSKSSKFGCFRTIRRSSQFILVFSGFCDSKEDLTVSRIKVKCFLSGITKWIFTQEHWWSKESQASGKKGYYENYKVKHALIFYFQNKILFLQCEFSIWQLPFLTLLAICSGNLVALGRASIKEYVE